MNYEKFKKKNNLSGSDVVKCLSKKYAGFTKIQQCMISNPSKYGVKLLPEAEKELMKTFEPEKKKRQTKATKRITARLDEQTYMQLANLLSKEGGKTIQETIENAIREKYRKEFDNAARQTN